MSIELKINEKKEPNDIRVGMYSIVRYIVKYCNSILEEKNLKTLHFSAVGGAIGKLLAVVEIIKIQHAGFYQLNKLATVCYQSVDSDHKVQNQRLYPKMEVTLSYDDFKEKTEGYQDKMKNEEREKLKKIHDENLNKPRPRGGFRGGYRGRRGFRGRRGGFRGRRGGFRGRRGGFRGGRGFPRGGPRNGPRGAPRGRGAQRGRGGSSRGGN